MLCCRTYKQEPCQNQCVFCREVRTERMTYHAMMAAKQLNPQKDNHGNTSQDKNKLNFIVLPGKVLEFEGEHGNLRYQKETG